MAGTIYQGNQSDYNKWVEMMGQKLGTIPTTSTGGRSTSSYSSTPVAPKIAAYTPTATYVAPTYTAPEEYVAPDYTAPTYDESKVDTLTQKKSAAGLRAARQSLQSVTGGYYENPNVKRMTLRDALAGYGSAVQTVMSGAETEARNQYNTEYGIEADSSKTNYNADVEAGKLNYSSALNTANQKYAAKLTEAEKNYQAQLDAEKLNYQTNYNTKMASYNAALSSYMANTYGTGATRYGSETNQYATSTSASSPTYARNSGATIPYNSSGARNNKGQWLDYDGNAIIK